MEPSQTPRDTFSQILAGNRPQAAAWVRGGENAPSLSGLVKFFDTPYGGILVEAKIFGLPNISRENSSDFYGIHIHERGDCSGDFSGAGGHYNPDHQLHPDHGGDLLPLLGSQGYAWGAFYDKRFQVQDILGRSVVIHRDRDDFTGQPSGGSGERIGCGVIYPGG